MPSKRALITGITGQTGSYLAELLLSNGYEVHGVMRRSSSFNTGRIDHIFDKLKLHYGDVTDVASIHSALVKSDPSEVYHLAAQSHVRLSFDQPHYTANVVAVGTLNMLEAIRGFNPNIRMYNASSSEMYGKTAAPQSISSPFAPRSPYGSAKLAAHNFAINYRESYGMFVANGILFNHESERRGETFVTRKITRALGRIKCGLQDKLYLGNLEARRDWGHARDYVDAMWRMLQMDAPGDYVVATGESHTVGEFLQEALDHAEVNPNCVVADDPRYTRPAEVDHLLGVANLPGWRPSIPFKRIVQRMTDHDLVLANREAELADS